MGRSSKNPVVDQRSVSVTALRKLDSGSRSKVKIDVVWDDNSHHFVYLYPDGGLQPGEPATFEVTWKWPALFADLVVRGDSEPLEYKFTRDCGKLHVQYQIESKRGYGYEARGIPGITHPPRKKFDFVDVAIDNVQPGAVYRGQIVRAKK